MWVRALRLLIANINEGWNDDDDNQAYIYLSIYLSMYLSIYRERERGRARGREGERERSEGTEKIRPSPIWRGSFF